MLVKATKTMASEIKKALKNDENFTGFSVLFERLKERDYAVCVDYDIYSHETDYNIDNRTFNVIRIIYPPKYYAVDRYITTKDISKIYDASDKTFNGFFNEIKEYIEI